MGSLRADLSYYLVTQEHSMNPDIATYNATQSPSDKAIYDLLARDIQWDYKNIVKRKGKLERLK
jgi:hypothetical protein